VDVVLVEDAVVIVINVVVNVVLVEDVLVLFWFELYVVFFVVLSSIFLVFLIIVFSMPNNVESIVKFLGSRVDSVSIFLWSMSSVFLLATEQITDTKIITATVQIRPNIIFFLFVPWLDIIPVPYIIPEWNPKKNLNLAVYSIP